MKKILAIAVASAIAAPAMADMSITGEVTAGYSGTTQATTCVDTTAAAATADGATNTNATSCTNDVSAAGGFGIDTANLSISASEQLENGLTVSATLGMGGLTRGADNVDGEDSSLKVAGDFGSFIIATGNSGSGISAVTADAEDLSEEVNNYGGADTDWEYVAYTTPKMGAVSLQLSAWEGGAPAVGAGNTSNDTLRARVNVAAGALSGFVDYTDIRSQDATRTRVSAKVDLGSAVVGLGYEDRDNRGTEYAAGVTIPVSDAVSASVGYGYSDRDAGTSATGYTMGATYSLSSNFSVNAKFATWTVDTDATATSNTESKGAVLATLSF